MKELSLNILDIAQNSVKADAKNIEIDLTEEKNLLTLRITDDGRGMKKDFSWDRSAERYQRMYTEISDERHGDALPFEEAWRQLKEAYEELDRKIRETHKEELIKGFQRSIRIVMTGRADGVISVVFDYGGIQVLPYEVDNPTASVTANFDHLLGMARGEISFDRLYLRGQIKITGNLSKGMELRPMLSLLNDIPGAGPKQ